MHPFIFAHNFRRLQKLVDSFQLSPADLVLDVGSGHNPNPRANVLCDRFLSDHTERNNENLLIDRPFVAADATLLPFKDKAFDFVICSHLLEHVPQPEVILQELERVGKRGYIETPSRVWEKVHSFPFHRWFVQNEQGILTFEAKNTQIYDPEVKQWITDTVARSKLAKLWERYFYELQTLTKYFWDDKISYQIRKNGHAPVKFAASQEETIPADFQPQESRKSLGGKVIDAWGRRLRRGSDVRVESLKKIVELCHCSSCKGELTSGSESALVCSACRKEYRVDGIDKRWIVNFLRT